MKKIFLFTLILTLLISLSAFAHSGRTDKDGCHTDSKTGIKHCH